MTMMIEWRREYLPDGSHGDVHLEVHPRGQQRTKVTACGRSSGGMRKTGSPFRDWEQVLCSECGSLLEV